MKRWAVGLAVVVVLVGVGHTQGAIEWRVSDGGNGHYYERVGTFPTEIYSWQDAKLIAEQRFYLGAQGHLVTITSAEENQFILDKFFQVDRWPTWIGLTDYEGYGGTESFQYGWPDRKTKGWVWVTGEPVEYTNWGPGGVPNNYLTSEEDFAAIGSQWNDHTWWEDFESGDDGHARFLVEYDVIPEPSTFIIWSLLGPLTLTVGWWRRRR